MLRARSGDWDGSVPRDQLILEIIAALSAHPLNDAATGTVIVGIGAPAAMTEGDIRPRIVIPLAWPGPLDDLQRAQIARADAIVAIDAAEHHHIASAIAGAPIPVVTSDASGADTGFLRSAVIYDAMEAITVISKNPALSEALPTPSPQELSVLIADATADAVLEALELVGGVSG